MVAMAAALAALEGSIGARMEARNRMSFVEF